MTELPSRYWETISGMQKSVRRGLEVDAGRFFFELAEEGYFSAAVNRLRVIMHEDVGLGDPMAIMFAEDALTRATLWKNDVRGENGAWRLAASNAILALCRAKKSRLADHFQAVVRGRNAEGVLEIPDYSLDMHTRKGCAMGRGIDHFRQVGALLENKADIPDPYEEECYKVCESGILERSESSCEEEEEERKPRGLFSYVKKDEQA
jgi:replication-associated recombination protein RarA